MTADNANERILSDALTIVGGNIENLWGYLDERGLAKPSSIVRTVQEQVAREVSSIDSLRRFRVEYAKERISSKTPINVLRGNYSNEIGYRSTYLAELRAAADEYKLKKGINTGQVEPALIEYGEMYSLATEVGRDAELARTKAAEELDIHIIEGFENFDFRARYDLLKNVYAEKLLEHGFAVARLRSKSVAFAKRTIDHQFTFFIVDDSFGEDNRLRASFVIGPSCKKVSTRPPFFGSFSHFPIGAIVPEFAYSCCFDRSFYPEFYLAAYTIATVAVWFDRQLNEALQMMAL